MLGRWSIEALTQSHFDFGTDSNNAHVQPGGSYHYHGMPEGFIAKQGGENHFLEGMMLTPVYPHYDTSETHTARPSEFELIDQIAVMGRFSLTYSEQHAMRFRVEMKDLSLQHECMIKPALRQIALFANKPE